MTIYMKRGSSILFSLIFVFMLILPLSLTNVAEGEVSNEGNRGLFSGFDENTSSVEEWFKDRLGLRDEFINAYEFSNEYFFKELVNPVYQYGKDGFVFFKMHNNIEYGEYHKKFAEMVADMQKYCESRGTKFYYVFNPEKESIYREYLPSGVNYNDEWVDNMLAYMDQLGVKYIDLRKTLTDHKDLAYVFNRQFDAGHWSQNGAFYGMQALTERIHKDIPSVEILREDEYDISTNTANKIYGSNLLINEEIPQYLLNAGYSDKTEDLATELVRSDSNSYFQLVSNDSKDATGISRLLFFEDDFYGPFAFARANETMAISCLHNTLNYDYYYNVFKPDVVVFENMEYVVKDSYFSQEAMTETNQNPAIIKNFPENTFTDRRDALLERTNKFETNAVAVVLPGKAIDKVFIDKSISDAKYSYLVTDKRVIDLKKEETGALTASIGHNDLIAGNEVILYYEDESGVGHYTTIMVTDKTGDISELDRMTDGVNYNKKDNSYLLFSSNEKNIFNFAVIQLMNSDMTEYLCDISGKATAIGSYEGAYCHQDFYYTVVIRGNSKLADETIGFKVRLEKGKTYWYSYLVDELSSNQIIVRDFCLLKSK